jgi:hypothetical protein
MSNALDITTAWVHPPRDRAGEDHLAVRAVGEAIYAELVPCVTNVTYRVRCYTFYPWFTWKFGQKLPGAGYEEYVRLFRRAECLHTLIGIRHEQATGELPDLHGGGLVGRLTLAAPLRELNGGALQLSSFADPNLPRGDSKRYFQTELGGLDQYYIGTLLTLDILGWEPQSGMKLTPGRGVQLARALEQHVPGELFWQCIVRDEVTVRLLDQLVAFCPCQLEHRPSEVDAILGVLLNRDAITDAPDIRDAFRLACGFLETRHEANPNREQVVWQFREDAYAGQLGTHPLSDPAVRQWAAYHQHELLSVTVQCLFHAVFRAVKRADDAGALPELHSSTQLAEWFLRGVEGQVHDLSLTQSAGEFFDQVAERLVPRDRIEDEAHELRQVERLLREQEIEATVIGVARVLGSLIGRLSDEPPYAAFTREESYFQDYPINLRSLRSLSRGKWLSLSVRAWLAWLVTHWGVGHHLRVALRKLHAQSLDTFLLRPTDAGLRPVKNIDVAYGNPRLQQVFRALRDLGMIDDGHRLTSAGEKLRRALHG